MKTLPHNYRLPSFVGRLDSISACLAKAVSWLALAMMLVTCLVVLLRYGLGIGTIWLQESVIYMHAAVFMLASAFTLRRDGHVRVDIFYRRFSSRAQAWINALGSLLLLLPFSVFITLLSWDFAAQSWAIGEVSADPGGIAAVYLLKSLLPLMGLLLILQALAELARNLWQLMTDNH